MKYSEVEKIDKDRRIANLIVTEWCNGLAVNVQVAMTAQDMLDLIGMVEHVLVHYRENPDIGMTIESDTEMKF